MFGTRCKELFDSKQWSSYVLWKSWKSSWDHYLRVKL